MKLYRPIIKEAFKIAWRNRFLWFFGLLAALVGSGGAYNLGAGNLSRVETYGVWLEHLKSFLLNWRFRFHGPNLSEAWSVFGMSGLFLILAGIFIFIFLLWLAVSAQGALAYGSGEVASGRQTNFQAVFKRGTEKFWQVLLLDIIFNFGLVVVLILFTLPFFILYMSAVEDTTWKALLIIVSFVVWVPLAVVFSIVIRYALIYCVNQEKKISEALSKAFNLFIKNWLVSLEVGFILFFLNLITGLLMAILLVFAALPFALLAIVAIQLSSATFLWLVVVLGILTFVALIFLYGAVWNVFVMAVWVLLFERITKGVVYSKILRWANKFAVGGYEQQTAEAPGTSGDQLKK